MYFDDISSICWGTVIEIVKRRGIMISVFDTNPVVFESSDRTLTISYNGVLCKDANG